jgi:4'-phosphopantetheinyl transferase
MHGRVQVYVYIAKASAWTPEAKALGFELLQPSERERAARFRFEADRRMYVAAHALLRRALSRHAPVDASDWRFTGGERERPEIELPVRSPRLRFSLSHTRSVAACAIADEVDVGFDVEDLGRDALEVADRFAPSERAALAASAADARVDLFFTYWTLKEAYMKACGLGLAIPLDQMAFAVGRAKIEVSFGSACADDAAAWRFEAWRVDDHCRAAIAVKTRREIEIVPSTA